MANEKNANIGTCPCPYCHQAAHVRKYRPRNKLEPAPTGKHRYGGKLYLYCPNGCGLVTSENQDYILDNATISDALAEPSRVALPAVTGDDPLPPPPEPEPAAAASAPAPAATAPEKKTKLDDWLL